MTDHVQKNLEYWERTSDEYQAAHGQTLTQTAKAWGVWRIPEADLNVLGDLEGKNVLELGCGAAQWSLALSDAGLDAVGLDLSERQLSHARNACREAGREVPLVCGDAQQLPFMDAAFDVVFADHGAPVFAPPERILPEAARVLRPGGLFAFCVSSPIRDVCWDSAADDITTRLQQDYFGLDEVDDGDQVCYQLPYGDWIRMFRRWGFEIDDLIELRPPDDATTSYEGYVPLDWARRWPAENIWKLRKGPLAGQCSGRF